MTFAILLGCAWEFDILQFRWNSLALFPVIVWGIHILAFSREVEEDRKKVELERTKEGINFFCWAWFTWHAFYQESEPTKVVNAEYSENAILIPSFIFSDLDLNLSLV